MSSVLTSLCSHRPPSFEDDIPAPAASISIDAEQPTYLPAHQPRPPSAPSVVIDIDSISRIPKTRPQPPTPPPRPPRRITPHGSTLIHYNFGGNVKASNVVRMQNGVPTLDLHEMRVKEAVRVTEAFVNQSHGHYRKVRVITGRGLHSVDGVPKIKPAVQSLLSGCNYREVAKGGCLEVQL